MTIDFARAVRPPSTSVKLNLYPLLRLISIISYTHAQILRITLLDGTLLHLNSVAVIMFVLNTRFATLASAILQFIYN